MSGIEITQGDGSSLYPTITLPRTADGSPARTVVLVEGISDKLALQALAARRSWSLDAEGVSIVPMGGATNIGRFLDLFGPRGLNPALAGLCDAREEDISRRGLERAGLGSSLTRAEMEGLGFYVCISDLEDEPDSLPWCSWCGKGPRAQGDLQSSESSRTSLRGGGGPRSSSSVVSSELREAGRSKWLPYSSMRSISVECPGRSMASLLMLYTPIPHD